MRKQISLKGYDVVAHVSCDYGHVQVLSNNSTHYIVVQVDLKGNGEPEDTGWVVRTYELPEAGMFKRPLRLALQCMVNTALNYIEDDTEACPGCGCVPGDGCTPGCTHPEGCGFYLSEGERVSAR